MMEDDEFAMDHHTGTPEYKAPELVRKQAHDKTVDWWSVGIIIYEMLIGITPFYNRNRQVLMSKIKHSKIVFPDRKRLRISYTDEMVDVISKLLIKNKSTTSTLQPQPLYLIKNVSFVPKYYFKQISNILLFSAIKCDKNSIHCVFQLYNKIN